MSVLELLAGRAAPALLMGAWVIGIAVTVGSRDVFKRILGAAAAGLAAIAALGMLGGVSGARLGGAFAVLGGLILLALAALMRVRESYGDGDLAELAAAVDADEEAQP